MKNGKIRKVKVKSEKEINLPAQARIEELLAAFNKWSNLDIFDAMSKEPEFISAIQNDDARAARAKALSLNEIPAYDALRAQRLHEQIRSVRHQWDKRMQDISIMAENMDEGETLSFDDIEDENISRIQIGEPAIDNIFGDGLTPGIYGPVLGKTYLIGGDEGVGKSRLMISCVGSISHPDREDINSKLNEIGSETACIYFQNEVPLATFKQWAKNKIVPGSKIIVSEKARLQEQLALIEAKKPLIVVIDSLHMIMECDNFSGVVRTLNILRHHAMNHGYALILICHLNKSGDIAGSKKIPYLVDCVLTAQGGFIPMQFIFGCPRKNRYGSTGVSVQCMHTTDGIQVISSEKGRGTGAVFAGPKPAIVLSSKNIVPKPDFDANIINEDSNEDSNDDSDE